MVPRVNKIPTRKLAINIPAAPPMIAPRLVSFEPPGGDVAESARMLELKVRAALLFLPALLTEVTTSAIVAFSKPLRPVMV